LPAPADRNTSQTPDLTLVARVHLNHSQPAENCHEINRASAVTRSPSATTPAQNDSTGTAAEVSLPRLYALRAGYLIIAVGLVYAKWPLLINHPQPWPLFEGVETCMLVALSLLFFLGLRYPIKMLPILLFEIGLKVIWLTVIAVPLLTTGQVDQPTLNVFYAVLWVVIPLAVLPWRYVIRQYVIKPGDPWRPAATRLVRNQL